MIRTILVPLDGSPIGEHALPLAMNLARRASATVNLVHVVSPIIEGIATLHTVADWNVKEHERSCLETVAKRVASAGQVKVTTDVLEGPVVDAICEHALATEVDLITMTTHSRGPLSRFWLGSVADKLIRRASTPVLLVRPDDASADFAKKLVLQRILIPLDGSELAEQILEPATELGNLTQAEYTLLRVIEPVIVADYHLGGNAVGGIDPSLVAKLQAEAQTYLDRVAERLRGRSLRVHTRVTLNRPAAVAILDEARAHGVNLIALETHGRGGLARLLLGSVADKVLRGAEIPVLVQRPLPK